MAACMFVFLLSNFQACLYVIVEFFIIWVIIIVTDVLHRLSMCLHYIKITSPAIISRSKIIVCWSGQDVVTSNAYSPKLISISEG